MRYLPKLFEGLFSQKLLGTIHEITGHKYCSFPKRI